MSVLLDGFGRKGQAGYAASGMVFQQAALVGFKQEAFYTFTRQEEQLPIRQLYQ
jgi:hypothetical protein